MEEASRYWVLPDIIIARQLVPLFIWPVDVRLVLLSFAATAEPGDEEAVTRAKYFIRDEFLVSKNFAQLSSCFLVTTYKVLIKSI